MIITAEFSWKEEYREELQKYALRRIHECRKKDPRWKNPLEVQLRWKSPDGEYRNILFSDLTQPSSIQARRTRETGWTVEALYTQKPGYWIVRVTGSEPIDSDFKKQMREYVFTQSRIQGFVDPVWIELQYIDPGKLMERFVIYEK